MSHVLWRWWSGCCPGDGSICETTVGYSRKCDTAKKRCDTASQKRLSVSGNGPDENGELTTGKSGSRRTSWGSPSFRKTPCDETGAFLRFSENPKVDILGVSSFEVLYYLLSTFIDPFTVSCCRLSSTKVLCWVCF